MESAPRHKGTAAMIELLGENKMSTQRVRLSVLAHEESSFPVEATHTHTSVSLISSDFLAAGTFFFTSDLSSFLQLQTFCPIPKRFWMCRSKLEFAMQTHTKDLAAAVAPSSESFLLFFCICKAQPHRVISSDSVVISNVTRRGLFWSAPIAHLLCRCEQTSIGFLLLLLLPWVFLEFTALLSCLSS